MILIPDKCECVYTDFMSWKSLPINLHEHTSIKNSTEVSKPQVFQQTKSSYSMKLFHHKQSLYNYNISN